MLFFMMYAILFGILAITRHRRDYVVLKDTLLNWCEKQHENSCAGHCDLQCNNEDSCEQDCDKCLDQVYWFQEDSGRKDYNCPLLLLKYVLRFTDKYSKQICSALEYIDLSKYPEYDIFLLVVVVHRILWPLKK